MNNTLHLLTGGSALAPSFDRPLLAPLLAAINQARDIDITVDLGAGDGEAVVYTCDLTHGYIDINGAYRT